MVKSTIIGFPRIGANRELKKATESYLNGKTGQEQLRQAAGELRSRHWQLQQTAGIDRIPSNDFSFYDGMLDATWLLGVIPRRFKALGLDDLDTLFAMAKGWQGPQGDVHALPMKKWFNTNYHYVVPELDDQTPFHLNGNKPLDEFREAMAHGMITRPVLIGPYTFLKLADNHCQDTTLESLALQLTQVYQQILSALAEAGAELIQLDEPALVMDMQAEDIHLFGKIYEPLLAGMKSVPASAGILLQTYFGDLRDIYPVLIGMGFAGIGMDFLEGPRNLDLIRTYGFPGQTLLYAGLVNGKNIWVNDYACSLEVMQRLLRYIIPAQLVVSTSCSLLHVPFTVAGENKLDKYLKNQLSFAVEKLVELRDLAILIDSPDCFERDAYRHNQSVITERLAMGTRNSAISLRVSGLQPNDFCRKPDRETRARIQQNLLHLPILPTTTIGSFPQSAELRQLRRLHRQGQVDDQTYQDGIRDRIARIIRFQEEIGLDVLVHGEYERNDMVEYFGEKLAGFAFTQEAWVQSYGTRCVKPPILYGDIQRKGPMTIDILTYAGSLTALPVKGMLTGPVTILNWSFVREDLPRRDVAIQIALAIRDEVADLEKAGIQIIQIDEAALREKLPLRKADWYPEYLDWAIPAFRLVHAGVRPETQIHTHMCYSEFADILQEIDQMDADVISFEAAKSDLSLLDALGKAHFRTAIGPGVYDIHSPRIPDVDELIGIIRQLITRFDINKIWINPDCGLKTRQMAEVKASLSHLVQAVKKVRTDLQMDKANNPPENIVEKTRI